jgi:hypothetical protein
LLLDGDQPLPAQPPAPPNLADSPLCAIPMLLARRNATMKAPELRVLPCRYPKEAEAQQNCHSGLLPAGHRTGRAMPAMLPTRLQPDMSAAGPRSLDVFDTASRQRSRAEAGS